MKLHDCYMTTSYAWLSWTPSVRHLCPCWNMFRSRTGLFSCSWICQRGIAILDRNLSRAWCGSQWTYYAWRGWERPGARLSMSPPKRKYNYNCHQNEQECEFVSWGVNLATKGAGRAVYRKHHRHFRLLGCGWHGTALSDGVCGGIAPAVPSWHLASKTGSDRLIFTLYTGSPLSHLDGQCVSIELVNLHSVTYIDWVQTRGLAGQPSVKQAQIQQSHKPHLPHLRVEPTPPALRGYLRVRMRFLTWAMCSKHGGLSD